MDLAYDIHEGSKPANKSTNDANGNRIDQTYLPFTGGKMTGQIETDHIYPFMVSNEALATLYGFDSIVFKGYDIAYQEKAGVFALVSDVEKATADAQIREQAIVDDIANVHESFQNQIDAVNADQQATAAACERTAHKNQANGYAGLDANAKIPLVLIPDSILGQLEYQGVFTPTAYPLNPQKGWFYISASNGSIGGVDYKTGDWAVYNGVTWDKIDNTDAVASVNGKIGVVVINGTEITVGNGDAFTIQQRLVAMMADIDARYTKAQTYSNIQIEQRISDLMALTNIKDTAIQFSAGVYDLAYNGSAVATFPISLVTDCNIVIVRVFAGGQAEYSMFRPAMTTEGVGMNMALMQKLDYAQITRVGANGEFALRVKANDALSTNTATMRMWGIKLSGFNATEVIYDHTASGIDAATVQEAIDVFYTLPHLTIDAEGYICVNYGSGRDITID